MHSHLAIARRFVKRHGQLHVVVPCFNPLRFISRYSMLKDFIHHAQCAGAIVWVAEAAFGNRPFEVTDLPEGVNLVQFRIRDELWIKESMINATVARLPHDWEYVAWIDGDVKFVNPDWVQETIQQLQHFDVVQMFAHALDLNPSGLPMRTFNGFPYSYVELGQALTPVKAGYYGKKGYFHPGYAWACTRDAWNTMGGLLDINIVGGADYQMAYAFYDSIENAHAIPFVCTKGYRSAVLSWQTQAQLLKQNIGWVPGTVMHYWHGKKSRRGYYDRWKILADAKYDPVTDLKRDAYGLWQLCGNKPKLRDDLRAYFRARQEDGIEV